MFETANFTYPTAVQLQEIQRVLLPQLVMEDPIFDYFPIVTKNEWRLKWRQRDDFLGLQRARGLGGAFSVVEAAGAKEYDVLPAVYGESSYIGEEELTERAEMASLQGFAPIDDIVTDRTQQLTQREVMRIRQVLWKLTTTGVYTVTDKTGAIKFQGQYPFTKVNAAVAWSSRATSTPFADIVGLRSRAAGQSATFGKGAKLFVNAFDFANLTLCSNTADLFGRRTSYGSTYNRLADINELVKEQSGEDDLPEIVMYDGGYKSDGTDGNAAGTFVRLIPTGTAVVLGARLDGSKLGEYRVCRNANNPDQGPGFYQRLRDLRQFRSPPAFEYERGHNGGPVVWYTQPIVILNIG